MKTDEHTEDAEVLRREDNREKKKKAAPNSQRGPSS
jgi:hypothetical protein